jgi:branched-chain amino acid transport system substrate-binding protein
MRKPKWFFILALLMALSLVAAACADDDDGDGDGTGDDPAAVCADDAFGCVEVAEGDPVVLGTLLVITTENASLGLDSQHGVEVAAALRETPNEVSGHPLEFNHQDDLCSPEGGTSGARALGTSCSSAALGVADTILSDEGIILMSSSNTSPDLATPENHQDFYFRTAHNDLIQGAAMAQFVSEELELTTAATIHDGSTYADGLQQSFADSFTSDYGGEIVAQEAVGVGDKDMKPVLTSIAAAGPPEFLFFPVFVAEGGLIAAQAREIPDLADTELGGADGMLTTDWIDAAGAANAQGVYLSGPDLAFENTFYEDTFLPKYRELFGKPTSVFHAHAFDATNIILDAIEAVALTDDSGSLFIPRTALKDEIAATSGYPGIVGELTCEAETGDCNPGASMSVSSPNEAGDGFDTVWRQIEAE